jgi:hypothetical protein
MSLCGSCFGSGKVTCSSCGGRRQHSRLTINGDLDISTCLVCGGSGKVPCRICGGRHDRPGRVNNGDIGAELGRVVTDWILRRFA